MNARTHALDTRNASETTAKRAFTAALLVFALFLAASTLVGAEEKHPQNAFVSFCRELGGKPKREATHVVSCTETGGTKTTCDFNKKPIVCTTTSPAEAGVSDGTITGEEDQEQPDTVLPSEVVNGGGQLIEEQSNQTDPNSVVDGETEATSGQAAPDGIPGGVIESDSSVTPGVPVDSEELPVFGQ